MEHVARFSLKSQHASGLIEEALLTIKMMRNREREELMNLLLGWMLVEKFGVEARAPLHAFHKFCVAECLLDDPTWQIPARVS